MTDRELLELAAKAADLGEIKIDDRGWVYRCAYQGEPKEWEMWNPLTDDDDALRLAVELKLAIHVEFDRVSVFATEGKLVVEYIYDRPATDPYAATRRAITRAAAEIGRTL